MLQPTEIGHLFSANIANEFKYLFMKFLIDDVTKMPEMLLLAILKLHYYLGLQMCQILVTHCLVNFTKLFASPFKTSQWIEQPLCRVTQFCLSIVVRLQHLIMMWLDSEWMEILLISMNVGLFLDLCKYPNAPGPSCESKLKILVNFYIE